MFIFLVRRRHKISHNQDYRRFLLVYVAIHSPKHKHRLAERHRCMSNLNGHLFCTRIQNNGEQI